MLYAVNFKKNLTIIRVLGRFIEIDRGNYGAPSFRNKLENKVAKIIKKIIENIASISCVVGLVEIQFPRKLAISFKNATYYIFHRVMKLHVFRALSNWNEEEKYFSSSLFRVVFRNDYRIFHNSCRTSSKIVGEKRSYVFFSSFYVGT